MFSASNKNFLSDLNKRNQATTHRTTEIKYKIKDQKTNISYKKKETEKLSMDEWGKLKGRIMQEVGRMKGKK